MPRTYKKLSIGLTRVIFGPVGDRRLNGLQERIIALIVRAQQAFQRICKLWSITPQLSKKYPPRLRA